MHCLTSPLPDMEKMLRRVASKPFWSTLDLKSAYKQIWIVPEHVERSTVTMPDGNMVSQVVQIGDCNAPATYQALMNHLFSSFIGCFMNVYLDDIVVYSSLLKEHVEHVKLVLGILEREKLYLSKGKLRFLAEELQILGRIIDNHSIWMDSDKVDMVIKWKTPTNRDLLRGFIGSVGYLADDVPGIWLPLGILSAITGDAVPFWWGYTKQRAFEDVKELVQAAREHQRQPLDYALEADPVWMVTDGCAMGISGVVSQGKDWKDARVAAFYSAKLNSAQQNYPVHKIELMAGIETMLHHADILQGIRFKWVTDHKGLTHLLNQENLSGRHARWLEKISSFDFEVVYIPGNENVLADALS
jgi:RNase H-like domain found in reverse transcriptase/Reverse transcriptase (RNA-dependent DNA polymerase)